MGKRHPKAEASWRRATPSTGEDPVVTRGASSEASPAAGVVCLSRGPATGMSSMGTTIDELTVEIRAFRDARDWRQFHNPNEL